MESSAAARNFAPDLLAANEKKNNINVNVPNDYNKHLVSNCTNSEEYKKVNSDIDLSSNISSQTNASSESSSEEIVESIDITLDKSGGVFKQILNPGRGDEYPGNGDRVSVHYIGYLLNREKTTEFDSNWEKEKCEFNLGRGMVIKGWDLGIATMKRNEESLFIIQPEYAYGSMGNPPVIPAQTPLLFRVKLYDWKLEDLSPKKDGSILRKVIEVGIDTTSPNDGAKVKVKLIGTCDNITFEEAEKEFLLGEGCQVNLPEGLEIALNKFLLKERSFIYLKRESEYSKCLEGLNFESDADIQYEITLLEFEREKEVWEMNSDEKLLKAQSAREKGIFYTQAGKFKVALRQFKWILACLENEPGVPPESQPARTALLLNGYLNSSICLLKLEYYLEAVKICNKALEIDPDNEKALFRRGLARMQMNDCEEALEDFTTLCAVYPENKAAKQNLLVCQEKIKKNNSIARNIYNNMFEKFKKQDEDRMRNMKTETGVWENEKKEEKRYLNETEMLIEHNNMLLRDANIIELSNTAC